MDDISCVILHTAGLPPAECQNSLPRPLARAASCNDEANELYVQWKVERERNPSNHKPQVQPAPATACLLPACCIAIFVPAAQTGSRVGAGAEVAPLKASLLLSWLAREPCYCIVLSVLLQYSYVVREC